MKTDRFYTDPAEQHVPLEQLRRYQAGALLPAEQHQVEKHLLDCELCADLLEGLAASPVPVTQRAVQDINARLAGSFARRRKRRSFYADRKNWSAVAAILLFILSGALVFYYNVTSVKRAEEVSSQTAPASSEAELAVIKPVVPVESAPVPAAPDTVLPLLKPTIAYKKPGKSTLTSQNAKKEEPVITGESVAQVAVAPEAFKQDGASVAGPEKAIGKNDSAPAISPATGIGSKVTGIASSTSVRMRAKASVSGPVVSGRVLSEAGEGLPGVTVSLKGTTTGTVTDRAGNYSLPLPDKPEQVTLQYSFIGYETTELAVKPESLAMANVKMTPDTKSLSEVVVVGYSESRNEAASGKITNAKPDRGLRDFRKYVRESLRYPAEASAQKMEGRVVVGFTVNPDGTATDYHIIKGLSPACNEEALRLVKEGPRWQPAQKDGQPISQSVRIAIRFKP